MTLTPEQFERAAAFEAHQQRLVQLQRMSYRELQRLLTGDPAEAALWVRSAAEYGVPAAQLRLGRMLLEGNGVERDERAALNWFERAAARGDAEAMNMVGRCYENGWGAAVDLSKAAQQYRSSAEAGHDWGEYNFGNMLFDGRGVPEDRAQALQWYLRAARRGHGRAMNLAARCFEEGWGCPKSPGDAADWYRRSAEAGYFRAQFNYAVLLAERDEGAAAAAWFSKALASGDSGIQRATLQVLDRTKSPALVEFRERLAAGAATRKSVGDAIDNHSYSQ
jgi:TPR repeat protein